jgi:hypothetical protein
LQFAAAQKNVSVDVEADDAPERIGVQFAGQIRLPNLESSADEHQRVQAQALPKEGYDFVMGAR